MKNRTCTLNNSGNFVFFVTCIDGMDIFEYIIKERRVETRFIKNSSDMPTEWYGQTETTIDDDGSLYLINERSSIKKIGAGKREIESILSIGNSTNKFIFAKGKTLYYTSNDTIFKIGIKYEWKPATHKRLSLPERNVVKSLLMLGLKRNGFNQLSRLPKDVILSIISVIFSNK